MTHTKILELAAQAIKLLSTEKSKVLAVRLVEAKEIREIFSYRFPIGGLNSVDMRYYKKFEDLIHDCTFIAELAQLNSECLCACFEKHVNKPIPVIDNELEILMSHSDHLGLFDTNDAYWVARLTRGGSAFISHIAGSMREGLIDDFFEVWVDDDDERGSDDCYNPDEDCRIIFDFL